MSFIDKIKRELLNRNGIELKKVEETLKELREIHVAKNEDVLDSKQKTNEISAEKSKIQKTMISKERLNDLQNIYNFVANYSRIKLITQETRETYSLQGSKSQSMHGEAFDVRLYICELLKSLNDKIEDIKQSDIDDIANAETAEDDKEKSKKKRKERHIFKNI